MSKHSIHWIHSSYREKLIEHLFIGELLKLSWQHGDCRLEISKPGVDNSGYDVIAEQRNIIRHIQIKASYIGGKTSRQPVHIKLSDKSSGCVIWIYFDEDTLALGPFLFFGGKPGEKLPDMEKEKTARHGKGDQDGVKNERSDIRIINKGKFRKYYTIQEIYTALFGENAHQKISRAETGGVINYLPATGM